MKNTSLKLAVAAAGLALSMSAMAGGFNLAPCKACHAVNHDVVGPSFDSVVKAYGSEAKLAAVFKKGFPVEERKVAESSGRWKGQAAIMTGQFNSTIKGHEEAAAKAVFEAAKSGKM